MKTLYYLWRGEKKYNQICGFSGPRKQHPKTLLLSCSLTWNSNKPVSKMKARFTHTHSHAHRYAYMYEYTKCVRDTDASMHEAAPAHTLTNVVGLIAYARLSFAESKTNTDMQQTVKRAQYDGCSARFLVCDYVHMMKPSNGAPQRPF